MSVDRDAPGWIGLLAGEGGEGFRLFVIASLCVLAVLILLGIEQLGG